MTDPRNRHCEVELVPYLREDLAPAERDRVERHLESCASCRDALADFRAVVAELRDPSHQPPEIDWRRYRAELRAKLEERKDRRFSWLRPRLVPVALAATVAALALLLTLRAGVGRDSPGDELSDLDQTSLGSRLDLLQHYDVVENLDFLEDLDVVQDLDDLAPVGRG